MRSALALLAWACAALTVVALPLAPRRGGEASGPVAPVAVPFDISHVKLDPGSLFGRVQERNRQYMLTIDPSELTCDYTSAANLTYCPTPDCTSKGDPTMPKCSQLPGREWVRVCVSV